MSHAQIYKDGQENDFRRGRLTWRGGTGGGRQGGARGGRNYFEKRGSSEKGENIEDGEGGFIY